MATPTLLPQIAPLPGLPFAEPVTARKYDGDTVEIMDAAGDTLAFIPGRDEREAQMRSAFLVAVLNLCAGLPEDGISAGRFAVVDVDSDDPFGTPVPRQRLVNSLIELLLVEDCLANPARSVVPDKDGQLDDAEMLRRLQVRRVGLLNHLAGLVNISEGVKFLPEAHETAVATQERKSCSR